MDTELENMTQRARNLTEALGRILSVNPDGYVDHPGDCHCLYCEAQHTLSTSGV